MNRNNLILRVLVASAVATGFMLTLSFLTALAFDLPERVPVHWNARGEADGYGTPGVALWSLPAITLALSIIMLVIPFIEPRRRNFEQSGKVYLTIWIAFLVFFSVVHGAILLVMTGRIEQPVTAITIAMGLMFVVIGNFMGKIRSNYFMGVRTPWTLSSERSWTMTHRFGGKIFVAIGSAIIVAALYASTIVSFAVMVVGLLGGSAAVIVYSWWAWRNDPERDTTGRLPNRAANRP